MQDVMSNAFEATHNSLIFSVSELSQALRVTVESNFQYVQVRGEISGYKAAASGHAYFSLKDENAVLDAICWKNTKSSLSFVPDDGMEVIATGKLTTFAGRSKYQIVIESLRLAGQGALLALLEKRKQALAAEGLFATERKRPLPFLPRVIGVVTSPTGAVIRDILHRLRDRCPCHVILWPVLVQGDSAAAQITKAIKGFNSLPRHIPTPDILIIARGGGSIEDLWPFNEENVVRAIAGSDIPTISAVGHETDTTLVDYAADCRAPTPTAAAEIAVPVRAQLQQTLDTLATRLDGSLAQCATTKQQKLDDFILRQSSPLRIYQQHRESLEGLEHRLQQALRQQTQQHTSRLQHLQLAPAIRLTWQHYVARYQHAAGRYSPKVLQESIKRHTIAIQTYDQRLNRTLRDDWHTRTQTYTHNGRLLSSFSLEQTLKRGFTYISTSQGKPLPNIDVARVHSLLSIHFQDGILPVSTIKSRKLKKHSDATQQGELL